MIARVEQLVIAELERRIAEALPELGRTESGAPEQVTAHIETRSFIRNVQEQPGLRIFGEVEAIISVEFYSGGQEFVDKSPLIASFMERPYLAVDEATHPVCELADTAMVEGPHLDCDVLVFKVTYPIFERTEPQDWQPPAIHKVTTTPNDIYPRPEPDISDEPVI